MADYAIPKNGVAFIFYRGLVSQADTKLLKSTPTLAAGDFKVSIDGGAFANLATLPTNTPSGVSVKFSLSAAEMTGDNIVVACIDSAGAEWCDQMIDIQTAPRSVGDLAWPTTTGRSIDVAATGEVGLDFNNVLSSSLITLHSLAISNTVVFTGNVSLAAGLTLTQSTLNTSAIIATGNGSGSGMELIGGTTGRGLSATGIGGGQGIYAKGGGAGAGALFDGGTTGAGFETTGGSTSGHGWHAGGAAGQAGVHVSGNFTIDEVLSAGTNSIPWSVLWDADAQSEVQDAIEVNNLDHLLKIAAVVGDIVDSSVVARLASKSATPAFTSYDNTTDSLEAIRDRGDASWSASASDPVLLLETTIATLTSQTVFTLTAGSADNDPYTSHLCIIVDSVTANQKATCVVSDYVGSTRTVTLRDTPEFTIAVGDTVRMLALGDPVATTLSPTLGVVSDGVALSHVDLYFNEVVSKTLVTYSSSGGVLTAVDPTTWGTLRVVVEAETGGTDLYTVAHALLTVSSASVTIPFTTVVTGTVSATTRVKRYPFSIRVLSTDEIKLQGVVCVTYAPY